MRSWRKRRRRSVRRTADTDCVSTTRALTRKSHCRSLTPSKCLMISRRRCGLFDTPPIRRRYLGFFLIFRFFCCSCFCSCTFCCFFLLVLFFSFFFCFFFISVSFCCYIFPSLIVSCLFSSFKQPYLITNSAVVSGTGNNELAFSLF